MSPLGKGATRMFGLVVVGLAAMAGAVYFFLDQGVSRNPRRHRRIGGVLLVICAGVLLAGLIYAVTKVTAA